MNPESRRVGDRLIVIEALVFLLPAVSLFYIIYQEDISLDSSQFIILAGVLMIVLSGLLLLRRIFLQLQKLHGLVANAISNREVPGKEATSKPPQDGLEQVVLRVSDLVSRYQLTDTELTNQTRDLIAVHELSQQVNHYHQVEDLYDKVIDTAMAVSSAQARRSAMRPCFQES